MTPIQQITSIPHLNILTFDGGPSALASILTIQKLQEENHGLLEKSNMFVGTSAGGLVALYLAHAMGIRKRTGAEAIAECIGFFEEVLKECRISIPGSLRFVSGLNPLLNAAGVRRVLDKHFKQDTLGLLENYEGMDPRERKLVSIVTFDVDDEDIRTICSFNPGTRPDTPFVELALACTAFPSLMPLWSFPIGPQGDPECHLLLEGAFSTNCVVMAAVSDALRYFNHLPENLVNGRLGPGGRHIGKFHILSMGRREKATTKNSGKDGRPGLGRRPGKHDYGWIWFLRENVDLPRKIIDGADAASMRFASDILGTDAIHRFYTPMNAIPSILHAIAKPSSYIERIKREVNGLSQADLKDLRAWLSRNWRDRRMDEVMAPAGQRVSEGPLELRLRRG